MPLVAWLLGIAVIVVGVVVALALGRLRPARATDREAAAAQKLSQCEAELAALRTATVESDRGLAVAEEKARRVPELEASLRDARDQVERTREEKAELKAQLATLQESLAQERARSEEKLALLSDTKARLAEQFKVVAEEVMGQHGETFKKQNKEQIDGLLTPLREQLTAFQTGLQTAHLDSAKDRERLAEQIRSFVTTGAIMTSETKSLTRALRGETQTQGAWGEMILETILERSGLREGEEYVTQESHSTEEGARLRPDVIVNLPDYKRIVVDSKVSLTAFTEYVSEGDPEAKAAHLARHADSLRAHIKGLSRKAYQQVSELDFVILFVPIEGALAAAMQHDPTLTSCAIEQNVVVCTPTTLMLALRTVANVWQTERRNKNAEDIAKRAGKLYDKFVGFIEDMQALGVQLDKARSTYGTAFDKLSTGQGNLVRQTEWLKDLGAKTSKALPRALVNDASPSTGEMVA